MIYFKAPIPHTSPLTWTLRFALTILLIPGLLSCSSDDAEDGPPLIEGRYEREVFETFEVTNNISYGSGITQGGETQTLTLDLYEPFGDEATDRPILIYVHSGGFTSGSKAEALLLAPFFAQSGYVVASIAYRLIDIERTSEAATRAVIDASHDLRAAIRYVKANSTSLGVDTLNIFIGGFSAGAFTALQTGYVNDLEEILAYGGEDLVTYLEANGGFEGSSGNAGTSMPIAGVFNIAGALGLAEFVEAGEPPLFSIHGTADEVVPFNSCYGDGTGVIVEGSNLIHQVADQVGLTNELIVIEGGTHTAIIDCEECPALLRDFIFANLQ
ncbi:MAG: alpha/beta hydrolase [Bacteroidota bacterium]